MLDGALGWISRPHVTGFGDKGTKYWKSCANGTLVLEQKAEILFLLPISPSSEAIARK